MKAKNEERMLDENNNNNSTILKIENEIHSIYNDSNGEMKMKKEGKYKLLKEKTEIKSNIEMQTSEDNKNGNNISKDSKKEKDKIIKNNKIS